MIGGRTALVRLASNILCVCTHNYFRSQITAALLRAEGFENVLSAGTATAYLGAPPHPHVQQAITLYGGQPVAYSAQPISRQLVDWADLIFCAEEEHRDSILVNFPECRAEVLVMNVADGGVDNEDAVLVAAGQIMTFIGKCKSSIR